MSLVKDALVAELQSVFTLSKEYADKIKNAETRTKSDFYKKKLKKNNQIAADMVIALDKLDKIDYTAQNKET